MSTSSVIYLAINLPKSAERRELLAEQEKKAGITIQIVPAVAGADLTDEQRALYDTRRRASMYTTDLTPNEQACMHSHLKALRTFLASDADYGVVFEDDVLLTEDFLAGINCLLHRVQGWEVAKLYNQPCRLYDICPPMKDAPLQPVFPKKIPWGAIGYLYSRAGAEKIVQHLTSFWMGADAMLAKVMLSHGIPVIGITPNLISTAFPENEQSDIDEGGHRLKQDKRPRTLLMYLRYRLSVLSTALQKDRMRALLRRVIRTVEA